MARADVFRIPPTLLSITETVEIAVFTVHSPAMEHALMDTLDVEDIADKIQQTIKKITDPVEITVFIAPNLAMEHALTTSSNVEDIAEKIQQIIKKITDPAGITVFIAPNLAMEHALITSLNVEQQIVKKIQHKTSKTTEDVETDVSVLHILAMVHAPRAT